MGRAGNILGSLRSCVPTSCRADGNPAARARQHRDRAPLLERIPTRCLYTSRYGPDRPTMAEAGPQPREAPIVGPGYRKCRGRCGRGPLRGHRGLRRAQQGHSFLASRNSAPSLPHLPQADPCRVTLRRLARPRRAPPCRRPWHHQPARLRVPAPEAACRLCPQAPQRRAADVLAVRRAEDPVRPDAVVIGDDDQDRTKTHGPECESCNASAAGRAGAQARVRRRR